MEIKLTTKSRPLTDEQREAIQGKLQEIKAIIKGTTNGSITDNQYREKSKRVINKCLEKFNPKTQKCALILLSQNPPQEAKNELDEQCRHKAQQGTLPVSSQEKKLRQTLPTRFPVFVYHFRKEGKKYVCKENAGLTLPLTHQGKPDLEQLAHEIVSRKFPCQEL